MPRDNNGNYTLPSGNPVIPGTIIAASWANPTMADIGQALTDSLDRFGRGGMQSPIRFPDGSLGVPSVSFANEITTGMYRAGNSDLRIGVSGASKVRFTSVNPFQVFLGGVWQAPLYTGSDATLTGQWNWTGPVPQIGGVDIATVADIPTIPDTYVQRNVNESITGSWTFGATTRFNNLLYVGSAGTPTQIVLEGDASLASLIAARDIGGTSQVVFRRATTADNLLIGSGPFSLQLFGSATRPTYNS